MDSSLAKHVSSRLCNALLADTSRDPHASWIAAKDIMRAFSEYVGRAMKAAYGEYVGMHEWHPYPKAQQVVSSTVQVSAVGIRRPCCSALYADVLHLLVGASTDSNQS
jgi:hypothetical protein